MPSIVEKRLRKKAKKLYPDNEQMQDRYVYGTMRKMGWLPRAETAEQ